MTAGVSQPPPPTPCTLSVRKNPFLEVTPITAHRISERGLEKIPLYRQLADLLVQLPNPLTLSAGLSGGVAKNARRVLQQLAPPAGNLVRVHVMMGSELRQGLLALQGFQSHSRLECR
jgi:hypothetical protein